ILREERQGVPIETEEGKKNEKDRGKDREKLKVIEKDSERGKEKDKAEISDISSRSTPKRRRQSKRTSDAIQQPSLPTFSKCDTTVPFSSIETALSLSQLTI